ncbi:MAG TPA: hypothetical protein VE547_22585, partial [Mycobacteriales bacterium]|nr:hypothetical protein [Mycobacteriales bacterium]
MRTRVVVAAAAAVVAVGALVAVAVPVIGSSDAVSTEIRTAERPVELAPGALPATVGQLWTAPTVGGQPSTGP